MEQQPTHTPASETIPAEQLELLTPAEQLAITEHLELPEATRLQEVIDQACSRYGTRMQRNRIRLMADVYGPSFIAYLSLTSLHHDSLTELRSQYLDAYQGSFTTIQQVAEILLDASGWRDRLEQLQHDEGITNGALNWNYPRIYQSMIATDYHDVIIGGRHRVFTAC